MQRMTIWNPWKYLQVFLLLILTPTRRCRENLLRYYEHKFEQLLEDQDNSSLQLDEEEEEQDEMKNLCREYTVPRSEEAFQVRRWILGNTKIGPVLDVEGLPSSKNVPVSKSWSNPCFEDRTVSWVRIVNGIDKYVTETSETISPMNENIEHRVTGKLCCESKATTSAYCDTVSHFYSLFVKRNWDKISIQRDSVKIVLQCQKAIIRLTAT